MTAALARKIPSPLERERKDVWAAAIVYCLGTVNFLLDKSQAPYMRADELADLFGASQKNADNKARQIRDALKIGQADPDWWRPFQVGAKSLRLVGHDRPEAFVSLCLCGDLHATDCHKVKELQRNIYAGSLIFQTAGIEQ